MAGTQIEDEFFEHLADYRLAMYKECQHAVWLDQIESHVRGKNHKVERERAVLIAERVQEWPGLIVYAGEMQIPDHVNQPIGRLSLHQDGLLCQLNPARCRYICRGLKSMKEHWRKAHQWSVAGKRGGSGQVKGSRMERRMQEATKRVQCQRFFSSRHGSQYFEVRQPEEAQAGEVHSTAADGEALWARLRGKVTSRWAERKVNGEEEEGEEGMGQEGEDDERDRENKEGEEGDDDNSGSNKQREGERLTKIQKACLHFCIELLDQSVTRREYDSALVLESSEPFEKDEFGGDGAYESDGSANASWPGKKGCLQFVARMMDRFMV
ncbi:hypothetical protein LTR66_013176 [Elasticomyces elasticus]|nr:hypothetical protein LTR66_013176 [Elasticomyces elasticus]